MSNQKSGERRFFGHPRALAYLAFTDGMQCFAFFGLQSLLVLYMVSHVLLPGNAGHLIGFAPLQRLLVNLHGPLSTQALSSIIFGFYTSVGYLLPLFGGLIGDHWLGQRTAVVSGAIAVIAGQLLLALMPAAFLLSLALALIGCGLVRGNISKQLSSLYEHDERRRAEGFQIYYVCLSACILAAPLVCGTLGELYGWRYGFLAGACGMMAGLMLYLVGQRALPSEHHESQHSQAHAAWQAGDGKRIAALLVVLIVPTCFMTGGTQLANAYVLWVRDHVSREAFSGVIPITWFQSMAAVGSIVLPPFVMRLWRSQARRGREPTLLGKMAIGCGIAATAFAILAAVSLTSIGGQRVYWPWLLVFHLLQALGALFVWPVGMALFSRAAPAGMRGTLLGIYYLSAFIAGNVVGWLGSFYSTMTSPLFWLMHAAIVVAGAVLVLSCGARLNRLLEPAARRAE
jgi:POT family proton-dependent oligopeptide transporter